MLQGAMTGGEEVDHPAKSSPEISSDADIRIAPEGSLEERQAATTKRIPRTTIADPASGPRSLSAHGRCVASERWGFFLDASTRRYKGSATHSAEGLIAHQQTANH